ncbi:hypothetical protein J1N35_027980 [Gossypium stocksii]|uniref:Uncharacterized protein n=1 Tax=Gossypium stocksii TaxID=47602 RepID=A0A9D3VB44_9ROSI|nr:hypothetical protein J1N35_027980 [Gossypium stocksii]
MKFAPKGASLILNVVCSKFLGSKTNILSSQAPTCSFNEDAKNLRDFHEFLKMGYRLDSCYKVFEQSGSKERTVGFRRYKMADRDITTNLTRFCWFLNFCTSGVMTAVPLIREKGRDKGSCRQGQVMLTAHQP